MADVRQGQLTLGGDSAEMDLLECPAAGCSRTFVKRHGDESSGLNQHLVDAHGE